MVVTSLLETTAFSLRSAALFGQPSSFRLDRAGLSTVNISGDSSGSGFLLWATTTGMALVAGLFPLAWGVGCAGVTDM